MPRDHGRILARIWRDPDFRQRTPEAQRLYMLLLTQTALNNAGILPLQVRKWAKGSVHTSPADVQKALDELAEHRYVFFDEDTEEAFVRTLMRNDGVVKQPNILRNALRCAEVIESPELRVAMAVELRRLRLVEATATAEILETLLEPFENPSERVEPFANPSRTLREPQGVGEGVGEGVISSSEVLTSSDRSSTPKTSTSDPPRFEEFWKSYPRHEGKIAARKAYAKAVGMVDAQDLIDGARRYADDPNREPGFTAHASPWLNDGRWEDDPLPVRHQSGNGHRTPFVSDNGAFSTSNGITTGRDPITGASWES